MGTGRWARSDRDHGERLAPALVTGNSPQSRAWFTEVERGSGPLATPATVVASVRFDGSDKRIHAKITAPNAGTPVVGISPTGRALLVLDRDDLYAFPITDAGDAGPSCNLASPSVPLRRMTDEGANYAAWLDDGRTIGWSFASHYHRVSFDTVMRYRGHRTGM